MMYNNTKKVTLLPREKKEVNHRELELINQGAYGCIFHPGINCKGKKENVRYITKIQKNADNIERELAISKYVTKIPRYTRFFAPIIKQCPVKIERKLLPSVRQCDLFSKMSESEMAHFEYVSNKVRYVGTQDIRDYILKQPNWIAAANALLVTHKYLLKAFAELAKRGLIHMDVKSNNMMYDAAKDRPIIIDFGISVNLPLLETEKDYADAFFVFDSYYVWSLEIMACNYMFSELGKETAEAEVVKETEIERVVDVFMNGYNGDETNDVFYNTILVKSSDDTYAEKYRVKFVAFLKQYVGKPWIDMYHDFIEKKYHKTWDMYGLAVTYLSIIGKMQTAWRNEIMGNKSMKEYIHLLENIILSVPSERPDIEHVSNELDRILRMAKKRIHT